MMVGRHALLFSGLLGIGLLLAACGGDDGDAPAPTPTDGRPTATSAASTPTATRPSATATTPATAPAAATDVAEPSPTPQSQTRATPPGRSAPQIGLPNGFAAYVVAQGFSRPTAVAVDPQGTLWVTEEGGRALTLSDDNGDGFFEGKKVFADGFTVLEGVAFGPDAVYLSHRGHVARVSDDDGDGVADKVRDVIRDLPNGRHQNNGIAFGPDGMLYVTNGSTCNDCEEDDERSATILQVDVVGWSVRVYARGLRNPYDLVFTPDGQLWATDNGSDPPCNTIDELNLIVEGGDYGWPYDPQCDALAKGRLPVADLGFNTSSDGIAYYDGAAFPADYRGSFFIAQWGANSGDPAIGKRVVRVAVRETPEGPEGDVSDFALGFDHPLDVAVDRDGSLLVIDYGTGELYRIVFEG